MNDVELKKSLGTLKTLPVSEAARSGALYRATIALAQPQEADEPTSSGSRERTNLGRLIFVNLAGAAVIAVGCFLALNQPAASSAKGSVLANADLRTLAQVQALFPGQLDAVIERDGRIQISLASDASTIGKDQPLIIQFERAGQALRVLSYSGRSVTIELNNKRFTFDALVTSEGGVMLSGVDFVWDSQAPQLLSGYRVKARLLTAGL